MILKNKRGLSVVILFLILLVLILITIGIILIATQKSNNINKRVIRIQLNKSNQIENIGIGESGINLSIEEVRVLSTTSFSITIKRNEGSGNLVKIKFIFANELYNYSIIKETDMKELEERTFNVEDYNNYIQKITEILIAPIFIDHSGKELISNITSSYFTTISNLNERELSNENCNNGIDDNGNGLIDCQDPECFAKLTCDSDCQTLTCSALSNFQWSCENLPATTSCGEQSCPINTCNGNNFLNYSSTCNKYCNTGSCDSCTCDYTNTSCGKTKSCQNIGCRICDTGTANCDENPTTGINGCEANLNTDPSNCGGCGNICSTKKHCENGICISNPQCTNNIECNDSNPCTIDSCTNGQCVYSNEQSGKVCANNQQVCSGIQLCTALTCNGQGSCSNPTQCNDCPNSLGICGTPICSNNVCGLNINSGAYCGTQSCPADKCSGNILLDYASTCNKLCSALGTCPACTCAVNPINCGNTKYCNSGSCIVCPTGYANCDQNAINGCEANLNTDSSNCGNCGNACGNGQICENGLCVLSFSRYSGGEMLSIMDKTIAALWVYWSDSNWSKVMDLANYIISLKPTLIASAGAIGYDGECIANNSICDYENKINGEIKSFVRYYHNNLPNVRTECVIFEDVIPNRITNTKCRADVCGNERTFNYNLIKNKNIACPHYDCYADITTNETQLYYKTLGRDLLDVGCDGISFSWIGPIYFGHNLNEDQVISSFSNVINDWRGYAASIGKKKIFVGGSSTFYKNNPDAYSNLFDYSFADMYPDGIFDTDQTKEILVNKDLKRCYNDATRDSQRKIISCSQNCNYIDRLLPSINNKPNKPILLLWDTVGDMCINGKVTPDDIAILGSKESRIQLLTLIDNYYYTKAFNPNVRYGLLGNLGSPGTNAPGYESFCGVPLGSYPNYYTWSLIKCLNAKERKELADFFTFGTLPNDSITGFLANAYSSLWNQNLLDSSDTNNKALVYWSDSININEISKKEVLRTFLKDYSGNFFTRGGQVLSDKEYINRVFKAVEFMPASQDNISQGISYLSSHSREEYFDNLWGCGPVDLTCALGIQPACDIRIKHWTCDYSNIALIRGGNINQQGSYLVSCGPATQIPSSSTFAWQFTWNSSGFMNMHVRANQIVEGNDASGNIFCGFWPSHFLTQSVIPFRGKKFQIEFDARINKAEVFSDGSLIPNIGRVDSTSGSTQAWLRFAQATAIDTPLTTNGKRGLYFESDVWDSHDFNNPDNPIDYFFYKFNQIKNDTDVVERMIKSANPPIGEWRHYVVPLDDYLTALPINSQENNKENWSLRSFYFVIEFFAGDGLDKTGYFEGDVDIDNFYLIDLNKK